MAVAVTSLLLGVVGSATGDFRVAFVSGAVAWLWASASLAAEAREAGRPAAPGRPGQAA